MKYRYIVAVAIMTFAGAAQAAGAPEGPRGHMPKTRQEAITVTKDRLAKLEKMTDQEWNQEQQARIQRLQKWRTMTPDQRAAARQKMMGLQTQKMGTAPAIVPAAPATAR